MHRAYNAQLGQPAMRDLLFDQRLRDDANDLATARQHGIGDGAHQADSRAAIDQGDAAPCQLLAKAPRSAFIRRRDSGARPAKNAKPPRRLLLKRGAPQPSPGGRVHTTRAVSAPTRYASAGSPA